MLYITCISVWHYMDKQRSVFTRAWGGVCMYVTYCHNKHGVGTAHMPLQPIYRIRAAVLLLLCAHQPLVDERGPCLP